MNLSDLSEDPQTLQLLSSKFSTAMDMEAHQSDNLENPQHIPPKTPDINKHAEMPTTTPTYKDELIEKELVLNDIVDSDVLMVQKDNEDLNPT